MVNISSFIKHYIILYIIINNFFQQQNCYEYKIQAKKTDSNLEPLNIDKTENECEKIIPSLFYPILIVPQGYSKGQNKNDIEIDIPFLLNKITGTKYYLNSNFLDFNLYLTKYYESNTCSFGLSLGYLNTSSGLNENEVLLSHLKEKYKIKKVFSFDKFSLNKTTINTMFYFGEIHSHFTLNEGIIGTCKLNEEDIFWGFSFNEMIINNKTLNLTRKKDNKLYKIYLTTEEYNITFPRELINEDRIINLFENKCSYNKFTKQINCINFFNGKDYIPLQLNSEDINITLDLDNFNRYYSSNNNDKEEIIKIILSNDNYIIFPLIMFKQFHIQFDGEAKVINFYTKDSSILKVKEEKKETPKNEDEGSSGLTVFLVILIILIIIGIGFGIFYFLRLRKNKLEKDINRFTKYEEEEDFKNMNENKVY